MVGGLFLNKAHKNPINVGRISMTTFEQCQRDYDARLPDEYWEDGEESCEECGAAYDEEHDENCSFYIQW